MILVTDCGVMSPVTATHAQRHKYSIVFLPYLHGKKVINKYKNY